jgi:hypothetical protein
MFVHNMVHSSDARGLIQGNIINPTAGYATDVRMIVHIRIEPPLALGQIQPPDVPPGGQVFEVPVYRSQAYTGELLLDHFIDVIGRWMTAHLFQLFQYHHPLPGHPLLPVVHGASAWRRMEQIVLLIKNRY